MSVQAVCWDLGGVLLRTVDRQRRDEWERQLGLAAGELERMVFENRTAQLAAVGKADEAQIWRDLAGALRLTDPERDRLAAEFFAGDRVDQELVRYIRSLRPRMKTGMISNAWPEIRRYLVHEWRIADAFDDLVLSAEVGLAKPDPAIYRLALSRLGVEAQQAVFVDDFEVNVIAARQVGMQAVHFRSPDQARRDVDELLGGQTGGSGS